jgi:hypothetical protein
MLKYIISVQNGSSTNIAYILYCYIYTIAFLPLETDFNCVIDHIDQCETT